MSREKKREIGNGMAERRMKMEKLKERLAADQWRKCY